VAGGSAAAALAPLRQRISPELWGSLRVTWVDERRVPMSSIDSNRGTAHRAGWLGPAAPVGLELPLWLDHEIPPQAVERVTRSLTEAFEGRLDVLLLGMGTDGHVASLFPEHDALRATAPVVLVDDSPKPPRERITLTLPCLHTATAAVLLATGAGKRFELTQLRSGNSKAPVGEIRNLTVVTDQDL
jgi:6-phosphogluconolactonase